MRILAEISRAIGAIIVELLSLLIKGYHAIISPLLGPRCRFHPSCSSYALEALKIHGPIYGLWLSAKRIARCNSLFKGGIDNVPVKNNVGADCPADK